MKRVAVILISCFAGAVSASEFASTLIYSSGTLGGYPYNDPCAVLGTPTSWVKVGFDSMACSLVHGAWNVTPDNKLTVVTLGAGGVIIVGFDHPVLDDPANSYGIDLIVFGNAFFAHNSDGYIGPTTDMDTVALSDSGGVSDEPVKVEVAAVLNPANPNDPNYWFPFTYLPADGMYPTNRFAWDSVNHQWGQSLNPLKPVNPMLKSSDFANLTFPQAVALYDGSAGGTGYDLQWLRSEDYQRLPIDPQTGKRWIQYVRFTSSFEGEIDAVSDVAPANVPAFPRGDLNYDYRVNLQDLMIFSQNWLSCTSNCQ